MRGSSGGTTTTIQSADPWSAQQPYLRAGFEEAAKLYESPFPQYFPTSTVVPFANETEQALQGTAARARAGSPLLRTGQQSVQDTLSGSYLNQGNPYLGGVVNRLDATIRPRVQEAFAKAGGMGGSFGEQDAYTRALADATAPYLFNEYGAERNRMVQSAPMAPSLAAADYADLGELANVGARRERLGEAQIADLVNRWNFGQNQQQQKLANYLGAIQGNYGKTESTSAPIFRNPAASAIGGATSGAGLAMAMQQLKLLSPGSPWGWALTGAGGLLGALG